MPTDSGFSRRLWNWLERWGFAEDPFALFEADQERPYLHNFFVDRPYFHAISGTPKTIQTAFLLSNRGAGKTATREMIAYECKYGRFRRRALAARYFDFTKLLEVVDYDLSKLTARHHIHMIVRAILKTISEDVPATYFELLDDFDQSLLMSYAAEFADDLTQARLARINSSNTIALDWNTLSPLEILETLSGLVKKLGQSKDLRYQAVYVLVDRVDETAAGPQAAAALLKPLVHEAHLLQARYIGFKFFLSEETGGILQREASWRPDRICVETIAWDEKALKEVVNQRLIYYSDDRVTRFEDLCESAMRSSVMERIIQASKGSPRTLIRLCSALIRHHVDRSVEPFIKRHHILDTLKDFSYQLESESAHKPLRRVAVQAVDGIGKPAEKGLYLDDGGHVWLNGEPLSPPLSDFEYRLLKTLYQQAPEIVPHETLIETIWPSASIEDGVDEQNLRKLINRLRQRLPEKGSQYIKNVRGRGYWLNINP